MHDIEVLPLIARWMHILAAVFAVGGVFYVRVVLTSATQAVLEPEQRETLREALAGRWRRVIHTCILLFLASGLYNYLAIVRLRHEGQALYHALFGVKFLLALTVFALAIALTGRARWSAPLRVNRRTWLTVLLVLATTIILISGILRSIPAAFV